MKKITGSDVVGFVYDTYLSDAIMKIDPILLLDNMPDGCNTPQAIYFQMSPFCRTDGQKWSLSIMDWFGDRSTIEICKVKTTKYTALPEAIRFLFRDMMRFLLARYPDDDYTCRMVNLIIDQNPELKEKTFYKNLTQE